MVATCGAVWLIVHGLWMQFQIEPTTDNLEEASAGRWLLALGVAAMVLALLSLTRLRRIRPVLAVAALLLVPLGETWANRATSPSSRLRDELSTFQVPAFFGKGHLDTSLGSDEVEISWRVQSSTRVEEACAEFDGRFRAWADGGSVTASQDARGCLLHGRHEGGYAEAQVVKYQDDSASASLRLSEPEE
jgi:hypothetical protein